ncbi:MAG: hypothetical protein HKN87_04425 [Saprospiraceae bacterium]|nr:hypothetical protein [Saprospiraceae bacterium]
MDINIRTINHPNPEKFRAYAEEELQDTLGESDLITTCNLHLTKEDRVPVIYKVVIEVHPKGRTPIAGSDEDEIAHQAVANSIKKVQKQLRRYTEKRKER